MGALLTHFLPSVLVISIPAGNIYSFILDVEGYPGQFFSIASAAGLLLLRRQRPDLTRPYRAFLPAVWLSISYSVSLLSAPFVPREDLSWRQHLSSVSYAFVGSSVILFGVAYWYVWTIWIPRRKGSTLEETTATLDDGTTITRLVQVPISSKVPIS